VANADKPSGFRPVGHLNGSQWNGKANKYYIASAAANIFIGDMMTLLANGSSVPYSCVEAADAATDVPVGPVIGIELKPDSPRRTYLASGVSGYLYIADDPDLVMEVQCNGTLEDGDIGSKAVVYAGAGSTTTGRSAYEVTVTTMAATQSFIYHVQRLVDRPENALGADAKVLVSFNVHEYGHGAYGEHGVGGNDTRGPAGHLGVHA